MGLQVRPQGIFPSQGTLQIAFTNGVPSVEFVPPSSSVACHGNCSATSLNVTVASVEVHTSGIDNMTGEWTHVCNNQTPLSFDIIKLTNLAQVMCGSNIQPETITNVRMNVTSASAKISGMGTVNLTVPSGKLEIPVSPLANVQAGKTTTIVVDFQPHIVCQGTGDCKLTPVLHARPTGPE